MIVVADTSPINYLILISQIDILAKMYGRVVIPPKVRDELIRPSAPEPVRMWTSRPPSWLEVRRPTTSSQASAMSLDEGERDAIALAVELRADRLIVDDRHGRQEAQKLGIAVIGTLGVLRQADTLGLLDLRTAVDRLKSTSFHIAPEVLARLLKDRP